MQVGYEGSFIIGEVASRSERYEFKKHRVYKIGRQFPSDTTDDKLISHQDDVPFKRFNQLCPGRVYEHEPAIKGAANRIEVALKDAGLSHLTPK